MNIGLLLVPVLLLLLFLVAIYFIKRSSSKIPINMIDSDAGTFQRVLLKPDRYGGVSWKGRDGAPFHLKLSGEFAYRGRTGPEYIADISKGKGVIIRVNTNNEVVEMNGYRLWIHLFSGTMKQIGDSMKTDLTRVLTIASIVLGVVLMGVLGAIIYVVQLMQSKGVA